MDAIIKHKSFDELLANWAKREHIYRAMVVKARKTGKPFRGSLAHASQLQTCRVELQSYLKRNPGVIEFDNPSIPL